jgi:hypothetical protein
VGKEQRKNEDKKELRRRTPFPLSYSVQNYLDIIGKLECSVVFVFSKKLLCSTVLNLSLVLNFWESYGQLSFAIDKSENRKRTSGSFDIAHSE